MNLLYSYIPRNKYVHVLRTETPQPITLLAIDTIPVALSNRDDPTIALSLCHHGLSRLLFCTKYPVRGS